MLLQIIHPYVFLIPPFGFLCFVCVVCLPYIINLLLPTREFFCFFNSVLFLCQWLPIHPKVTCGSGHFLSSFLLPSYILCAPMSKENRRKKSQEKNHKKKKPANKHKLKPKFLQFTSFLCFFCTRFALHHLVTATT
jgi:hypothetical protein